MGDLAAGTPADLSALVARALDGDAGAWRELHARLARIPWGIARAHRLPDEDAADVVQVTFLRLFEHLDTVRDPARLRGWLATTARRESLTLVRRRRRVRAADEDELDQLAPAGAPSDLTALRDDLHRAVWRAFLRLDPRCQRILRVLIIDVQAGRPSYETAKAVLQMPQGSLGPTRRRCLDRMRGFLAEGGYLPR